MGNNDLDYAAIGHALEERIKQMGMTRVAVAKRAERDVSNLSKMKSGGQVTDQMLQAWEQAVRWPPGTLRDIGLGGQPPELGDDERLDQLEDDLHQIKQRLARIERRVLDAT